MGGSLIKKALVSPLNGRLTQPFKIASGGHDSLRNALFAVELADGTRGYGEAAPASHITGETQAGTISNLRAAARRLVGRDACDVFGISAELKPLFRKNHCAATAVEMALLDALSRRLKMPLWKFFGDKCRTLRSDMTVVLGTEAEALCAARAILRRGIKAFKIKTGGDTETDFLRVRAVARAAGKLPLYLDMNEGFTASQSLSFLRRLGAAGIRPAFVEQPVPRGDWPGLKRLTRESGLCIGADESITGLSGAAKAIKERAVKAINLKIMKFGLLETAAMARLCKANGIKLMIGGMLESSLAMTASAHIAAGIGGFDFIDLDTPLFIKDKVMRGFRCTDSGEYDLSGIKAGIGVVPAGHMLRM